MFNHEPNKCIHVQDLLKVHATHWKITTDLNDRLFHRTGKRGNSSHIEDQMSVFCHETAVVDNLNTISAQS